MSGISHLAQTQKVAIPLTIKDGQPYSYPLNIGSLDMGSRGLQIIIPDAGWTAADLTVQFSDDAWVDPAGNTEDKKLGTYSNAGQSVAANWYSLTQKDGTLVRLTNMPTGGAGALKSVRVLHAEFWAVGTWRYMRLVSTNTATTAVVNQSGANRVFSVKQLL